jgi:hypothetical protein
MKHKVSITPLNCSYDIGIRSLMKFEISEHNAVTDRSIYCKNPDLSWFKMKSVTLSPYLEPAFFGLMAGDIITVEFDALLISGVVNDLGVSFRSLDSAGNAIGTTYAQRLPNDSLKSHFKHFKIPFIIMPDISGGDGIILNIRPEFSTNSEIIIKNIEIEIETANNNFAIKDNVVSYKYQKDFLDCIKLYSGTDLNTAYNGLKTVHDLGKITFPDINTMAISASDDVTNFKGLMAVLPASKYYQPQVVYLEYKNNDANNLIASAMDYDNKGTTINSESSLTIPASTGAWRKAIFYFKGRAGDKRNIILNFGRTGIGVNAEIRNVRFSVPRFDDAISKREPNKLEELYSNLGTKLRA